VVPVWVVVSIIAVAVIATSGITYQLVRQQGRLLLRMDAVDALLTCMSGVASAPGVGPQVSGSRLLRSGLPAGTRAPNFHLKDIYGSDISLADFAGQRVLLVFTDPQCGPCELLLRDLSQLHRGQPRGDFRLLAIARGDAASNREKARTLGIDFPVALQPGWRVSKSYGIFATPVAFLVSDDGVLEDDVVVGRDEIVSLANHVFSSKH
jgi:peroxiredoxin